MKNRPTIVSFFCFVVVGAHTHCVLSHGAELVNEVIVTACDSVPLGQSRSCENESSCIFCKGATLVESTVDSCPTQHLESFLLSEPLALRDVGIVPLHHGDLAPIPFPLDAGAARALLQSFQI